MKPLYLSCVVLQEAAMTVRDLGIAWKETLLSNQCSLLVTKTLDARRIISFFQNFPLDLLYIWNNSLMWGMIV